MKRGRFDGEHGNGAVYVRRLLGLNVLVCVCHDCGDVELHLSKRVADRWFHAHFPFTYALPNVNDGKGA